jgi:hypothetical protein
LVIYWHAFIGIGTPYLDLHFFQSRLLLLLLLVLSSAISIGRRQLLLLLHYSSASNTASCPVRRHQHLCRTAMPWTSWRYACANPD